MTTVLNRLLPLLTYRLTRDDWAAFERLPSELPGWEKLFVFGPPIVCGAAVGLFDDTLRTLLPISIDSIAGKLLLGCGLLVLAHGITILLLTLRTRWRIARWREPTDVTVLDGDLNGFTVTTGAASQRYAWTDVSVVETATQVVFVHAPCAATVVPRGAFESPEAMHLYAHVARERSNQVDELP